MAEYIDRALIPWRDEVFEERCHNDVWDVKVKIVSKAEVDRIPAADVRPVVRGKWERKPDPYEFFDTIPVCSNCGCTTKWREEYNYCPNCGAEMEES